MIRYNRRYEEDNDAGNDFFVGLMAIVIAGFIGIGALRGVDPEEIRKEDRPCYVNRAQSQPAESYRMEFERDKIYGEKEDAKD